MRPAPLTDEVRRTPEQARAVLIERARRLARRPPTADRAVVGLDAIVFELGAERYAIATRHVREVVQVAALTPIPGTADFVLGVTNLRGDLVVIVDLRRLLGTAAADVSSTSPCLILGDDRAQLGVLTDAVQDVTTIPPDAIMELAASSNEAVRPHLHGVTRDGLIILDATSLLDNVRLVSDSTDETVG